MCCARLSSRAKSTSGGSPSSPYWANCSASRTSRAALASTRLGTQPSFVQVPPMLPRSTSATSAPSSRARRAAITPAGPPPTTITSNILRLTFSGSHRPVPRRSQPERSVLRLHRAPYHSHQLVAQRLEVRLLPQLGAESGQGLRRIVLVAVEAAIDEALDAPPQRVEQGRYGQRGSDDGDLRSLPGEGAEDVLQGDHAAEVEEDQRCGERTVDEGAVDDEVYVVEPIPQHRDPDGRGCGDEHQSEPHPIDEIR